MRPRAARELQLAVSVGDPFGGFQEILIAGGIVEVKICKTSVRGEYGHHIVASLGEPFHRSFRRARVEIVGWGPVLHVRPCGEAYAHHVTSTVDRHLQGIFPVRRLVGQLGVPSHAEQDRSHYLVGIAVQTMFEMPAFFPALIVRLVELELEGPLHALFIGPVRLAVWTGEHRHSDEITRAYFSERLARGIQGFHFERDRADGQVLPDRG